MTVRSSPPSANICISGGVTYEETGFDVVVVVVVVCVVWLVVVEELLELEVAFELEPADAVNEPLPGVGGASLNAVPLALVRWSELPLPVAPHALWYVIESVSVRSGGGICTASVSPLLPSENVLSKRMPEYDQSCRNFVGLSAMIA